MTTRSTPLRKNVDYPSPHCRISTGRPAVVKKKLGRFCSGGLTKKEDENPFDRQERQDKANMGHGDDGQDDNGNERSPVIARFSRLFWAACVRLRRCPTESR